MKFKKNLLKAKIFWKSPRNNLFSDRNFHISSSTEFTFYLSLSLSSSCENNILKTEWKRFVCATSKSAFIFERKTTFFLNFHFLLLFSSKLSRDLNLSQQNLKTDFAKKRFLYLKNTFQRLALTLLSSMYTLFRYKTYQSMCLLISNLLSNIL
jgi:hypothetical protein